MINSVLPESSRVHVYPTDMPIDKDIQITIIDSFKAFLHNWNYHGTPLQTDVFFLYNRFLILVINDETIPGGCSLDVLSRFVTKVENEVGVNLNNRHNIYIHRDEEIFSVPFNQTSDFVIRPDDKVVNLLCENLNELKTNFFKNLLESNYARLFSV
ncbi:MAG: hypothetical protein J5I91_09315 [Bacteroidetes bacterium]|nr:hypothetical protein [Bacteroidota bacterium]